MQMGYYTGDPVADAGRYFAERDREIERRPVCSECDRNIMDAHFFEINGEYICKNCMNDNHKKFTEDYMED